MQLIGWNYMFLDNLGIKKLLCNLNKIKQIRNQMVRYFDAPRYKSLSIYWGFIIYWKHFNACSFISQRENILIAGPTDSVVKKRQAHLVIIPLILL